MLGYFLLRLLKGEDLWKNEHKEVYVYLAYLLLSLINPEHQQQAQKYLIRYHVDLEKVLEEAENTAQRYYTLKFNADDLLITCGIFKPHPHAEYGSNMERGKIYYKLTANCALHLWRKMTPVIEVFEQLAACFEEYQRRLQRLRRAYFSFVQKLSAEEKNYLMAKLGRLTLS